MTSQDIKNEITWSDSEDSWDEFERAKDRKCTYCTKTLQSTLDIPKHEENCSIAKSCSARKVTCKDGSLKFICDICCSTYKYLFKLAEHEKRHEPPGGFICRYCDTRFCTEVQLEQHTEEHHKVFKCQICKETFETAEKYISHIRILHNGQDKEYKTCEECGRQFKSPLILKFHKETNCGTNKRYKCQDCGKTFQTNGTLKTHGLIHSGEKRFCCSFCGSKFTVKGLLIRHERTHTGEKPYKCNLCSKSFSHRDSLITHSTVHTGVKPYICECCGSRFSCSSNIIQHRRKRPDTCGLPKYCTKLSKACPRPGVNNPQYLTSHEPIRLFKSYKVLKTSEKEMLKDKIKVAREQTKKDVKTKRKRRKTAKHKNLEYSECGEENLIIDKIPIEKEFTYEIRKTLDSGAKKNKKVKAKKERPEGFQLRKSPRLKNENKLDKPPPLNTMHNENIFSKIVETTDTDEIKLESFPIQGINDILMETWNFLESSKSETANTTDNKSIKNEIFDSHVFSTNNFSNTELMENEDIKLPEIDDSQSNDEDFDHFSNHSNHSDDDSFKQDELNEPTEPTKLSGKSKPENSSEETENTDDNSNEDAATTTSENFKSIKQTVTDPNNHRLYDCYECSDKIYSRKNSYQMHLKKVHHKTEEEIKYIFEMRNETLSEYACQICGKYYSMPKALETHLKRHGTDGSLIHKCKTCTKYFASKDELKSHYQIDHKDKITCHICNKTYKDSQILYSHKKKSHPIEYELEKAVDQQSAAQQIVEIKKKPPVPVQTFICNICGKILRSRTALNVHERSDCGKKPIFKCNVCGKALTTAGILKSHMLIHSGELPHQCSYCDKRFRQRQQLTCHERTHTGEKPYPCTYCDKAFGFVENLYIHLSTHTGIKRFMCTTCGDRFSCISGLKNHWRTNATTCGSDPNRSTKAVGEYMGFQKGRLVHKKKTDN